MLDRHIHEHNNVADRLLQHTSRSPPSDAAARNIVPTDAASQTKKEKEHDGAVRRLDKEMDAMTDPLLVREAREDQRGTKQPPTFPIDNEQEG